MFYALLVLIAAAVAGADQLVKALIVSAIAPGETAPLIPGIVHLAHLRNTGAAFSLLEGKQTLLLIVTVVFFAALIYCAARKILSRPYLLILSFVAGGAIGNLIDRLRLGYVIDMFEVEFIDFAVFNVADMFITVGAIVLVLYTLLFDREKGEGSHAGSV